MTTQKGQTVRGKIINEIVALQDQLFLEDETLEEQSSRLLRLRKFDDVIHWLAGEAASLGLNATRIRLAVIDDDVAAAIAICLTEIRGDVQS